MAPFPWVKMLALMTSSVSQVTANYGLTSYVGYMVAFLQIGGDDKDNAGYFAGVLSSAYMVGCVMSAYMWSLIGDRYSRHLVLYVSLVSTMIFSIGFGLSTTVWQAYTCRFFLGAFNGIQAIIVSLVYEVCGEEHAIVGMAAITSAWSVGVVIGPGIGGILAKPVDHYPGTFSESGLFSRFPYLLPNIAVASFALFSFVMVFVFLQETTCFRDDIQRLRLDSNAEYDESCGSIIHSNSPYALSQRISKGANHPSLVKSARKVETSKEEETLLVVPRTRLLLFVYGLYSFLHSGFDEVLPLWMISSVAKGGLNWTTAEVGQVLLMCGLTILIFESFAVPGITKRIGIALSNKVATSALVPVLLGFPLISRLHNTDGHAYAAVYAGLCAFYTCSNATFLSLALGINNAVEEHRRGELNGIATTVGSLAKVLGPPVCSVAFAACINGDHQFPGNVHLIFMAMSSGFLVVAIGGWKSIEDNMVKSDMSDTDAKSAAQCEVEVCTLVENLNNVGTDPIEM